MTSGGFLADVVLVTHAGVVIFVVLGQALVMAGGVSGWNWIRNRAFRLCHLAVILVVAAQTWLGITCPLTDLEQTLRGEAGQPTHDLSFIGYWVSRLLFYQAPGWVFVAVYTAFAALVVASWWYWPPRRVVSAAGR